jgi:hypothetical protein
VTGTLAAAAPAALKPQDAIVAHCFARASAATLVAAACLSASAAETGPADSSAQKRSQFVDPADGQFDLSEILERPHGFLPVPIIVTEPAVGYGGGAIGMFLRPREEAGKAGWSRPDISAVGGVATENGTWLALAGDSSRWLDGRLQTLAGAGVGKVNLDFYGAGLDQPDLEQKFRYSLVFSGAIAQADWQLSRRSRWAIGLRYVYTLKSRRSCVMKLRCRVSPIERR